MARYYDVHPSNPQPRVIRQVVEVIKAGGVIAYPTDSGFALGTRLGNKAGLDRIRQIRRLSDKHNFTVTFSQFSQVGKYVEMNNRVFRAVKAATPGPYTFILKASRQVPRVTWQPKKHTIGIRVPDHITALSLLDELGEPLVSSTLILPSKAEPEHVGWLVADELEHDLDAVLDSGDVGHQATTVVNLTEDEPVIERFGAGDPQPFQ